MSSRSPALVAGAVLVGALLLLAGFALGSTTASQPGAGAATPSTATSDASPSPGRSTLTVPPADTSTASPGAEARSSEPSSAPADPSTAVDGKPGENVLAASGSGTRTLRFTPQRAGWQIFADYRCRPPSIFNLEVRQGGDIVVSRPGRSTEGTVRSTLPSEGDHALQITGDCRWSLRASG
jgi:hypothetical protein